MHQVISRGMFDGLVDGYWEKDRTYIKYFWDYDNNNDSMKFNMSFDAEIPISTESVPKPQTGSIIASYQVDFLNSLTR